MSEWEEIKPRVWKPDIGESIEGTYVKVEHDTGAYSSNAYYLNNSVGEWLVWGTAVLDERMAWAKVGENIRITYKEQKINNGKPLKIFKVERQKGNNGKPN